MRLIPIYLDQSLASQIKRIRESVKTARTEKPEGQVVLDARGFNAAKSRRLIQDSAIKALMVHDDFKIDQYCDDAGVRYTFSELKKQKSDFVIRHTGSFVAGLAASAVFGGGVGAGLLWGGFLASFMASPIGPLAYLAIVGIGALALLTLSAVVIGVACWRKTAQENQEIAQHQADIGKGSESLKLAIDAAKTSGDLAKKQAEEDANVRAGKIADIKKFPGSCLSAQDRAWLDSEGARVTGGVVGNLAVISLRDIKQAAAKAYINQKFDELKAQVKNDFELSLLPKEVFESKKAELLASIEDKKKALLGKMFAWVNEGRSSDNLINIIDNGYKEQFAMRLAVVIKERLYKGDSVAFRKSLESESLALEACDNVLARYEQQAILRVNKLMTEWQGLTLMDLPLREQQEKAVAVGFNREMNNKLDAMLDPTALATARQAKEDIQPAHQMIKHEITPTLNRMGVVSGSVGNGMFFAGKSVNAPATEAKTFELKS